RAGVPVLLPRPHRPALAPRRRRAGGQRAALPRITRVVSPPSPRSSPMKRTLLPALALLVLAPPAWCQSADDKKVCIAYLQKLQTRDGGFLPAADAKAPTLGATSSAVRALGYLGGEVPDPKAAADFVAKCHDADTGGFANEPGGKPA